MSTDVAWINFYKAAKSAGLSVVPLKANVGLEVNLAQVMDAIVFAEHYSVQAYLHSAHIELCLEPQPEIIGEYRLMEGCEFCKLGLDKLSRLLPAPYRLKLSETMPPAPYLLLHGTEQELVGCKADQVYREAISAAIAAKASQC